MVAYLTWNVSSEGSPVHEKSLGCFFISLRRRDGGSYHLQSIVSDHLLFGHVPSTLKSRCPLQSPSPTEIVDCLRDRRHRKLSAPNVSFHSLPDRPTFDQVATSCDVIWRHTFWRHDDVVRWRNRILKMFRIPLVDATYGKLSRLFRASKAFVLTKTNSGPPTFALHLPSFSWPTRVFLRRRNFFFLPLRHGGRELRNYIRTNQCLSTVYWWPWHETA